MGLKRAKVSWQMGWEIRFRAEGFSKGTKNKSYARYEMQWMPEHRSETLILITFEAILS